MEQSTDRRVRRTRAQLRRALTTLLAEKDLSGISVKELTDLADVNRGTFYCHYKDIFDMLEQVENELFAEFSAVMDAYSTADLRDGLRPILADVFRFVRKNADLCTALLTSRVDSAFFQRLNGVIFEKCMREWGDLYSLRDTADGRYYLDFLVAGAVGMVRTWVAGGLKESPEDMAALAEGIIRFGVQSLRGV